MKRRMIGGRFPLFLFTVLMMGLAFEARAAVFTVDRTDDPDPTTAMACDDATPNDCSLRGAIVKANAAADADEIKIPASATPYTLSIAIADASSNGDDGDLDIINDLTITGDGADVTTIDGNGIDRVFNIAGAVTIRGVTITGGKAADNLVIPGEGGGILIANGLVTLDGIAVDDNKSGNALFSLAAPGGGGGGIAVLNGIVTVNHSTISNNHTGDGASDMSLRSGNGGPGGGLFVAGGAVAVKNSTVSGNVTGNGSSPSGLGGPGGGIFVSAGTVTLNNVTVTGNTTGTGPSGGGSGGGVAVTGGTLSFRNSIVAKNSVASGGTDPDCDGTITSSGFNLIGDGTGCTGPADGTNGDNVGTGASPIDPKLGLLQNNGGHTKTYALLAGSPAIDTADNASCETDDQRGDSRPADGNGDGTATCDKGAFELNQCGDGVVQQGEQCDDGNTTSGDGCSSTCQTESSGGGGGGGCSLGISSNGFGAAALFLPFSAVVGIWVRRRRGFSQKFPKFLVLMLVVFLAGFGKGASAMAATIFASNGTTLRSFDSASPGTATTPIPITGLQGGELILGLDFRPATGQLYGLGSTSRLYILDPTTGVATQVGTGTFSQPLSGTSFGFDFNPVTDLIRVVSDADQNLRLPPDTSGLPVADSLLNYDAGDSNAAANPNIVGTAYSSNFAGATSTTLFGIDASLDILVMQGSPGGTPTPPNFGTLFTIGSLGVDTSTDVGFDIAHDGTAFASLRVAGVYQLYTIDLSTGAATLVGNIATGLDAIRSIAVKPEPAGQLQFSAPNYSVNENGVTATITVTRTGGSDGEVTVDFATSDGTATAGADYTAVAQTITFANGDATDQTISIPITNDTLVEGNETVNLTLSNPTGGATLGTPNQAVLTIVDDDSTAGAEICNNGIDDDGDSLTDCADPDCTASSVCTLDVSGGGCGLGDGSNSSRNLATFLFPILAVMVMALRRKRPSRKV